LQNRAISTFPLSKPFFKRNELRYSYKAQGVFFSPYKALMSLKTCCGKCYSQTQGVVLHRLPLILVHCGMHFLCPFDIILF